MNFNIENSKNEQPVDMTKIGQEAEIEASLTMQPVEKLEKEINALQDKIKNLEEALNHLNAIEFEMYSIGSNLENDEKLDEEASYMIAQMKKLIDTSIPDKIAKYKSEVNNKKETVKDLLEKSIEKKN